MRERVGYLKEFSLKISQRSDVAQETRRLQGSPRKLNSMMFMGIGIEFRLITTFCILDDHGVSFPRALSDELVFEMRLAPAGSVVKGSDETKLNYELNNIQLEYEVIHSKELADESMKKYLNGKRILVRARDSSQDFDN